LKLRALVVAFIGTALVFAWQASTVHFNYAGNWTGLFCTGANLPPPPELEASTYRSTHPTGYDGQMYRYIAHDPFFRKGYDKYVDDPRLRYRRILVPLLAYAVAFGRQSIIDYTFELVILASVFAGCYWCSRYCALFGKSEWWGLLFVLVPGTITSFDRMLVDSTLTALLVGFLVYAEGQNWRGLFAVSLLGLLARESGIILSAALVLAALWRRDLKRAVLGATAALPALAWWGFVWNHTKASPAAEQIMTYPLIGLLQRFLVFRDIAEPWKQAVVRITDVVALAALLICLGLAVYWIIPERNREIQFSVGLFVVLGLVLGTPGFLIEPYGFVRPISPLLVFLMLRSVTRGAPAGLAAVLVLTLSTWVSLANQVVGIAKGLLR
jgi:hypothetical protein